MAKSKFHEMVIRVEFDEPILKSEAVKIAKQKFKGGRISELNIKSLKASMKKRSAKSFNGRYSGLSGWGIW